MSTPELSVIICTCNRATLLHKVFENLKAQKYLDGAFTWELVLVDNNSVDDTENVVKAMGREADFSVRYVFEPRQGKSFALNSGIEAAQSDCLAFTDDDVVIDHDWLASVRKAFSEYPNYYCFGGKVLPILNNDMPPWISENDDNYRFHGGPIVGHDRGDAIKEYDASMYMPIGANMFIRKAVIEKYGGFSTQLGYYSREALIYGEDSEIMFRFKYGGEAILYYPDALIYHPAPTNRMRKSYFKKWCWGVGRGRARWLAVPTETIRYGNIPRYLIKELLRDLINWAMVMPSPKKYKRFYYEMQIIFKLGMFYEFYMEGD